MTNKNQSLSTKLSNQEYKACGNDFKIEVRNGRIILNEETGIRTILGFLEYFEKDVQFIVGNEKDNYRNYNSEYVVYNGTDELKVNKHENLIVFVQKYKYNECISYYLSEHDFLVAKYSNYVHEIDEYIKIVFMEFNF
jgi:hypothetical protein